MPRPKLKCVCGNEIYINNDNVKIVYHDQKGFSVEFKCLICQRIHEIRTNCITRVSEWMDIRPWEPKKTELKITVRKDNEL